MVLLENAGESSCPLGPKIRKTPSLVFTTVSLKDGFGMKVKPADDGRSDWEH